MPETVNVRGTSQQSGTRSSYRQKQEAMMTIKRKGDRGMVPFYPKVKSSIRKPRDAFIDPNI
jgi:hypothetical protein